VVVLDLLHKERSIALAMAMAAIGFATTLTIMNVDGFIVRQNITRAVEGEALDVVYLASLSSDSVPTLVTDFQDQSLPGYTRDAVGAVLVCQQQIHNESDKNWRSFTTSGWRADKALHQVQSFLDEYQITDSDWPVKVITPGSIYYECYQDSMGD
jgi:hypothetical protein